MTRRTSVGAVAGGPTEQPLSLFDVAHFRRSKPLAHASVPPLHPKVDPYDEVVHLYSIVTCHSDMRTRARSWRHSQPHGPAGRHRWRAQNAAVPQARPASTPRNSCAYRADSTSYNSGVPAGKGWSRYGWDRDVDLVLDSHEVAVLLSGRAVPGRRPTTLSDSTEPTPMPISSSDSSRASEYAW